MNSQGSRKLYRSIASCIAGNFFALLSAQATAIMLGLYLSYINNYVHPVSAVDVGLIGTGYRVAEFIGDPVMGALSDMKGRKPLMFFGPLVSAVVVVVYPATASLVAIFALLAFEGLSAAMRAPATLSFLADATSTSDRLRGRTMGVHQITILGGMVLGYAVGGLLWDALGINAFRIITLAYLLGAGIILLGIEEQLKPSRQRIQEVRRYLRITTNPVFIRFLPAWIAMSAVLGAWLSQTVFQLSAQPGQTDQALVGRFSSVQIGVILAILAIVFAGGTLAWGLLMDRLSKTTVMLVATLGAYLYCVALLVMNHSEIGSDVGLTVPAVFTTILLGAGIFIQSGFAPAALAYLADVSEDFAAERGAIIGVYYVFLSVGQLLGTWFGGVAAQIANLDGLIFLNIGLVTVGLVTLLLIRPMRTGHTHGGFHASGHEVR
ncbi:MAG: MFS transporter [Chloroflexi bacterium]|nr:MFS transporter [Chloroflexota bacterium]